MAHYQNAIPKSRRLVRSRRSCVSLTRSAQATLNCSSSAFSLSIFSPSLGSHTLVAYLSWRFVLCGAQLRFSFHAFFRLLFGRQCTDFGRFFPRTDKRRALWGPRSAAQAVELALENNKTRKFSPTATKKCISAINFLSARSVFDFSTQSKAFGTVHRRIDEYRRVFDFKTKRQQLCQLHAIGSIKPDEFSLLINQRALSPTRWENWTRQTRSAEEKKATQYLIVCALIMFMCDKLSSGSRLDDVNFMSSGWEL